MFRQILFLLAVMSVAWAALARLELEKKPDKYKNCDGCWVSKIQQFIPVDQSVPNPSYCGIYTCTATDVEITTCGAVAAAPPCFVTVNESLPYPDCCLQVVCPTTEASRK